MRDRAYTSAELLTHHTNFKALNFYKRGGFKVFNVIHYASVYPYIYDQHELSKSLTDLEDSESFEEEIEDDDEQELLQN